MLDAILNELKLDAVVITDPYNMRHVSGFRGGEGALYVSVTQKVLITDSRYTEQAAKRKLFYDCGRTSRTYKRADFDRMYGKRTKIRYFLYGI